MLAFGIPFLGLMISFCAYGDVKKPNLNWDNEADVCKSNNRGAILFLVIFFAAIGAAYLMVKLELDATPLLLVGLVLLAADVLGTLFCYRIVMKAADELPTRY